MWPPPPPEGGVPHIHILKPYQAMKHAGAKTKGTKRVAPHPRKEGTLAKAKGTTRAHPRAYKTGCLHEQGQATAPSSPESS